MKVVRPKSKNHLYLIIGTAMAVTLAYLWVGPKLVKKGAVVMPAAAPAASYDSEDSASYRTYAYKDHHVTDRFPYRFRLSGGI